MGTKNFDTYVNALSASDDAASGDIVFVSQSNSPKKMALWKIDHSKITGKGSNTHAQIDSHISNVSNPHTVTKTQVSLANVTDDAQLKRADGDINSFTEKTSFADDDIVLIEDSAASYAKKKVKKSNLGLTTSDSVTTISGTVSITAAQCTGRVKLYTTAATTATMPAATVDLTATIEIGHSGGLTINRDGTDTFTIGDTTGITSIGPDLIVGGIYKLTCYVAGVWKVRRGGVQPKIEVRMSTAPNVAQGSTDLLAFDTEVTDNNNDYTNTAGNYKATPRIPGRYRIKVLCRGYRAGNYEAKLHLYIDGSSYLVAYSIATSGVTEIGFPMQLSLDDYVCNGTTYFQVYGESNNGTTTFGSATAAQTRFQVVRVPD